MPEALRHGIWERLLSGRHAALVGAPMPAAPGELRLIRVSCDVPPSTLGPLDDARRRLELVLGEAPILEQARDRVLGGLRRRLLGEPPTTAIDAVLVELGNRLVDADPRRSILVFEAVEAADPATLAVLQQIILRPGWMRLPILLLFRAREPAGAAGSLLGALRASEGLAAVVGAGESVTATTQSPDHTSLRGLGPEPLTTLRAGATIGSGFEVELCATLLEQRPLAVLLHLQAAIDHGVPLEDRGEGRIHLPPAIVEALRAGVTPSLANYWHRRLAEILGGDLPQTGRADADAASDTQAREAALLSAAESTPTPPTLTTSTPPTLTTSTPPAITTSTPATITDPPPATITTSTPPTLTDPPPAITSTPPAITDPTPAITTQPAVTIESQPTPEFTAPSLAPLAELPRSADAEPLSHTTEPHHSHRHRRPPPSAQASAEPDGQPLPPPPPVQASPPAPASPTPHREAPGPRAEHPHVHAPHRHRRGPDAARAASHLDAIDEGEAAAARYIQAARQAAEQGLGAQGLGHGRQALAILGRLAPTDARRRLRIAALIELARIQWSSLGADAHLTLETALITARQAQAALLPGDPPALQAELALVIAGVGYDRGDLRALEEALSALMSASQALMAAGDARGAAALLNDQAAIYIRLGDHVRATHLLVSSRQVFEAAGDDDKVALRELADTHHLLARVPLHAPLRPGREDDALSLALDHALVAEKLLRRLGDARAVARVWETMGRIEIAKRRHERAGQRLAAALEVQRSLGDAIGMARTTAALADLLAETGRIRESLGVLASSIGLNREKGSPLGLGLNRRALQRLRPRITGGEDAVALARVEAALAAAEQLIGRYPLPEGQGEGPG